MSRCGRCMLPMRDGDLGSGAESGSNSEAGFVTEAQSTQRDFYFKLSSRPLCAYLEIPAMIFFENGVACLRSNSSRSSTASFQPWSAGIQVDMDVSGGILASLDAGHPRRHDGV